MDVKINRFIADGSGYTKLHPDGVLSPDNYELSGPTKLVCFGSTVWPDTGCS
jgi:hypothetical protein